MTAQPLSTPFIFDREFDAAGEVVRETTFRAIKRAYSPAEVEALVAQARLEARETALAESESLRSMALSTLAQAVSAALPGLAQVAHAHREQSAELALAAARVICGAALERFPRAPLDAALEALGQEIDASPRLVVRAAGLDETVRAEIVRHCAEAGFTGQVAFRDGADLPAAGFQLEWADGRAAFEPEEAFVRMAEALNSALAAEAGHAETVTEGSR